MILRQFLHETPVGVSYLVGCGGHGVAAVIDPVGDIEVYQRAAEAGNMRIVYVIDSHVHADHVSAAPELVKRTAAEYVLFAGADVNVPFKGVHDGETLSNTSVCWSRIALVGTNHGSC